MGKCYFRLGMFRDAEKMFKSALKQQEMIDVFLHLARVRLYQRSGSGFIVLMPPMFPQVYIRLDQPMAALEVYRTGLDKFPEEVSLLTGVARIYEAIGNLSFSAKYYKNILTVG